MGGPLWASLVAWTVKHLPTMWETRIQSLGWEDPLEKEMATHSSIHAWKIPWTKESGGLQSMGSQRVRHDWATSLHFTSLGIVLEIRWLFTTRNFQGIYSFWLWIPDNRRHYQVPNITCFVLPTTAKSHKRFNINSTSAHNRNEESRFLYPQCRRKELFHWKIKLAEINIL